VAKGDAVVQIVSVGAGVNWTFQPDPDVEVMITEVCSEHWVGSAPDGTPGIQIGLTDGTNVAQCRMPGHSTMWRPFRLFLTNTVFFFILNEATITRYMAITGVQTK